MRQTILIALFTSTSLFWAPPTQAEFCPGLCTGPDELVCQKLYISQGSCRGGTYGGGLSWCMYQPYCYQQASLDPAESNELQLAEVVPPSNDFGENTASKSCGEADVPDDQIEAEIPEESSPIEIRKSVEVPART